ncbi:DUF6624 domain-containing protein [Amphritea sp.]|uniref:DUF6624 domain-containing protein n=1 Tax=Amphritea sp. TaxID=1872502 RepID=UPI003A8C9097
MNQSLADELISMMNDDQRLLQQLFETGELPTHSYHPAIKALHEQHTARLKTIIHRDGWPGIALVGLEGAKAAWLVVQHSVSDEAFMSSCVELLQAAVAREDIEAWQLAFLQDRVLTLSGKPQRYGTQFDVDEQGWPTPYPIDAVEKVNERRAALGLNSLEQRHAQMMAQERQRRVHAQTNDS